MKFLSLRKEHPEYFYNDSKISVAFGCPSNCIWNGGFCESDRSIKFSEQEIKNLFQSYKDFDVNYLLTFSNYLCEEKHMSDEYGNLIASIGNVKGNGVIVASDLMKDYLHSHYKNYFFVESVSRHPDMIEEINSFTERGELVTLPVKFNNDFEFISKLKHPEKIVILCNDYCVENCSFRVKHRDMYNAYNLGLVDEFFDCPIHIEPEYQSNLFKNGLFKILKTRKQYISRDLLPKYKELGIDKVKIQDRGETAQIAIPTYLEMLVLPEYQNLVEKELVAINSR